MDELKFFIIIIVSILLHFAVMNVYKQRKWNIKIISGDGMGQIRKIKKIKGNIITINKPFNKLSDNDEYKITNKRKKKKWNTLDILNIPDGIPFKKIDKNKTLIEIEKLSKKAKDK